MLFHRPRVWNESEQAWMGVERKRGKLADFNRLLSPPGRDGDPALRKFQTVVAERERLFGIEYVIVLDSDTQLPRDAARGLVGLMHHPLNRPGYDEKLGRVVDGYGILQPRVDVNLPDAQATFFSRLTAGDVGVDPYTNAVSDVYQDAFDEGSFVGKGIYHVDTFEKACGGRFPENAILSHDLIESAFARSGLAAGVVLYEDTPSSYAADVARRQRWVRGDWQLLHYLTPWHKTADGRPCGAALSNLSRWKLFDNLRRSLVPIAVLLTLIIAALAAPSGYWTWAMLAVGYFFLPPLCVWGANVVSEMLQRDAEESLSSRLGKTFEGLVPTLARAGLSLVFLPYEAWIHTVAIIRTLWRMAVTKKHLLEWRTAAESERLARTDHASFWESMWPGWVTAAGLVGWLLGTSAETSAVIAAGCLAVPWVISPSIAFLASRPARRKPAHRELNPRDVRFLRKITSQNLVVLRPLRRGRGPLPATGQRAGGAGRTHRTTDQPDQHRPGPALAPVGSRLRVRHPRPASGPRRPNPRLDQPARTARVRALLQLVRHASPGAAGAEVRLGGRQRQLRRVAPGDGPGADRPGQPTRYPAPAVARTCGFDSPLPGHVPWVRARSATRRPGRCRARTSAVQLAGRVGPSSRTAGAGMFRR